MAQAGRPPRPPLAGDWNPHNSFLSVGLPLLRRLLLLLGRDSVTRGPEQNTIGARLLGRGAFSSVRGDQR